MLDLQKRIQEDYHDTLLKRISKREVRLIFLFSILLTFSCQYHQIIEHKIIANNIDDKNQADEVEKQLQKLLNPPEDIRDLERILFTSQSIVLVNISDEMSTY